MRSVWPYVVMCSLMGGISSVAANEEAAANPGVPYEQKQAACAACHGENGAKPIMPEYPIIAGQHANYIAHALKDYRNGRRNNPIMGSQVQALQLTDDDIERLAAHFSAQQSPLSILKK